MNAKETLRKIAEALNIATESPKEETIAAEKVAVSEVIEATTPEDVKEDAPAAVVESNVVESTKVIADAKEEALEPEAVSEDVSEPQEDPRVAEMQSQIEELKAILKNALSQEPEEVEENIPEIKENDEGLTHSPEKPVAKKAGGIGKKGESIQSRVYKYINNN